MPPGVGQAGTKKRKRKVPERKAPLTPISEFVQTRGAFFVCFSYFLFFNSAYFMAHLFSIIVLWFILLQLFG